MSQWDTELEIVEGQYLVEGLIWFEPFGLFPSFRVTFCVYLDPLKLFTSNIYGTRKYVYKKRDGCICIPGLVFQPKRNFDDTGCDSLCYYIRVSILVSFSGDQILVIYIDHKLYDTSYKRCLYNFHE